MRLIALGTAAAIMVGPLSGSAHASVAEPAASSESPPPNAEPETEAELREAAEAAFEAKDYARVVELAAKAYALTGATVHLYAQAQAERFRGDCQAALALYARVLAAGAGEAIDAQARDGIRLCEEALEAAPPESVPVEEPTPAEPVPDPSVEAAVDPQPVPDREPEPDRRPWTRDPLAGGLLGVGLVGVAAGGTLTILASTASRSAEASGDESDYAANRDRYAARIASGAAVLAVGGALLVGAVIRYAIVRRRSRAATVSVAPNGFFQARF